MGYKAEVRFVIYQMDEDGILHEPQIHSCGYGPVPIFSSFKKVREALDALEDGQFVGHTFCILPTVYVTEVKDEDNSLRGKISGES